MGSLESLAAVGGSVCCRRAAGGVWNTLEVSPKIECTESKAKQGARARAMLPKPPCLTHGQDKGWCGRTRSGMRAARIPYPDGIASLVSAQSQCLLEFWCIWGLDIE